MTDLPLAEYVRVSRVGERDEDRLRSPDFQREAIRRYAESINRRTEPYPEELDVSGSKAKRPVLDRIIEDVKLGVVGGVVVAKLDRLSRMTPKDRVLMFESIESAGGVILSAGEQLDVSTPEGRFARDVFLGVARMQWEKYKEGFDHAKKNAMENGIPIGPTPFGYRRRDDGTLEIDPVDGPVLVETFTIAAREAEEERLRLATDHIRANASKGHWTAATVRRLLSRTSYLGIHTYGELTVEIPRLIPKSLWLEAQVPPPKRRRPRADFPLSGLAECESCGYPMVGARGGRDGRRMYRCSAGLSTSRHHCEAPAGVTAATFEEHVRSTLVLALSRHAGFTGGEDPRERLAKAQAAMSEAEMTLDDVTSDLDLRRSLGRERHNAMVAKAAGDLEAAEAEYQEAARHVTDTTSQPAADLVANASLEELGPLLRGALETVTIRKGHEPLDSRVTIVPKGAPRDAGLTAA